MGFPGITAYGDLYFVFFGVFRLGAYIDIMLIICALFLILRLGSYLSYEEIFREKVEVLGSK